MRISNLIVKRARSDPFRHALTLTSDSGALDWRSSRWWGEAGHRNWRKKVPP